MNIYQKLTKSLFAKSLYKMILVIWMAPVSFPQKRKIPEIVGFLFNDGRIYIITMAYDMAQSGVTAPTYC